MTTLEDRIRASVEGFYYSDQDTKEPWEPFEDYSQEDVKEYIENDVTYWLNFIEKELKL